MMKVVELEKPTTTDAEDCKLGLDIETVCIFVDHMR